MGLPPICILRRESALRWHTRSWPRLQDGTRQGRPPRKTPRRVARDHSELHLFESRSPTMPNFPANSQIQIPAFQLKPANLSIMKTQPTPFQMHGASPATGSNFAKTSPFAPDRTDETERLAKIVQEQKVIIHQMQAMLLQERAKNSRNNSTSHERTKKHYIPPVDLPASRDERRREKGTDLDAMYQSFVRRVQGWEKIKQGKSRPPSQAAGSTISRIQDSSQESRDTERMTSKSTTKRKRTCRAARNRKLRSRSNDSRASCVSKQRPKPARDHSRPRDHSRTAAPRKPQVPGKQNTKVNKTLQAKPCDSKQKKPDLQARAKPAQTKQPGLASRKVMNQIADLVVDLVGKQLVSKSKAAGRVADRPKKR